MNKEIFLGYPCADLDHADMEKQNLGDWLKRWGRKIAGNWCTEEGAELLL